MDFVDGRYVYCCGEYIYCETKKLISSREELHSFHYIDNISIMDLPSSQN